jgi:hypothetical protein
MIPSTLQAYSPLLWSLCDTPSPSFPVQLSQYATLSFTFLDDIQLPPNTMMRRCIIMMRAPPHLVRKAGVCGLIVGSWCNQSLKCTISTLKLKHVDFRTCHINRLEQGLVVIDISNWPIIYEGKRYIKRCIIMVYTPRPPSKLTRWSANQKF